MAMGAADDDDDDDDDDDKDDDDRLSAIRWTRRERDKNDGKGDKWHRARAFVCSAFAFAAFASEGVDGARARATYADPVAPFAMEGTVEKEYVINVMSDDGRKIVGRRRGVSARACARGTSENGRAANGRAVVVTRPLKCAEASVRGEVTSFEEMLPACAPACRGACGEALSEYAEGVKRESGFGLTKEQRDKVTRACETTCVKDCTKSGRFYDFIIPFRF